MAALATIKPSQTLSLPMTTARREAEIDSGDAYVPFRKLATYGWSSCRLRRKLLAFGEFATSTPVFSPRFH